MGLFSTLLGHAGEADTEAIEAEFQSLLAPQESIEKAFKLVRDLIVFTDRRIVLVDKQGVTGKKREYLSLPYKQVTMFSVETAGRADLDSDVKVWVRGATEPFVWKFPSGGEDDVARLLAAHVL
ncbi:PH domain-containing protein [Alienimonas californiensis]|uniref:Bacterial Pleckstrin homology domain-containing protein n=1 Tax=Alienimonas californiensis TaxID=2527989 RepID=A0A517PFK8_9PLAN|nr:PH domain-containing protein [Alienimonas californiensis]QDT18166.1 hypothetical protein CA12_43070 [Alienimonas californiensis]